MTTVAREVGVEGLLRRSGEGAGAAGIWPSADRERQPTRGQPDDEVRAIAEVATARPAATSTCSITVEAQGEVASLSYTINEMISNPRDTTLKNTEQDWLKTNLAKFSRMPRASATTMSAA